MDARFFPPYDEWLAQRLIDRMDLGMAVRDICDEPGMPHMETFKHWRKTNKGFAADYAAAVERKRNRKSIS